MVKKCVALLIALCMLVCTAGCGADPKASESSSSNVSSSKGSSSGVQSGSETDASTETDSSGSSYTGDISDVKGDISGETGNTASLWSAPEGYTIVIPASDTALRPYAVKVQKYFSDNFRITLPIVTDSTAATRYEILVGKTNRTESSKNIANGKYSVSVKNNKLLFEGSHAAMIDAAVQKFLTVAPKSDREAAFSGNTDFKATVLGDYQYVWGDEFEGNEVDFTKWTFEAKMSGTASAIISSDRDVIDIGDGRLKLYARQYTDPAYPKVKYKMPISVVTKHNMMFTYGYCEIRAKLPCFEGAWPSFWTQSSTGIGERKCTDYFVEIDVFEVFGSTQGNVVSNIHKWYTNGKHTMWNKDRQTWTAPNPATINDEYHTYGWQWTPTEMVMYVDSQKIMTYDITATYDNVDDMSGFHDPQFIIFNNHLFTDDDSFSANSITGNEAMLPSEYFIDYFRLYQRKGEGKIWIDETVHATFSNR